MTLTPERARDQRLMTAVVDFVAKCRDPAIDVFRDAVANWGDEWCGVSAVELPAASMLESMLEQSNDETHALMSLFTRERASLRWEQAYSDADKSVGEHMLASYGYAEIVGKQGPFFSKRIRAGIAVYGPGINYPLHQHDAEEIYVVLAGSASFRLGDSEPVSRSAGAVIHHASMMGHGLHTNDDTLVIFYLWQGGNLREKPSFL